MLHFSNRLWTPWCLVTIWTSPAAGTMMMISRLGGSDTHDKRGLRLPTVIAECPPSAAEAKFRGAYGKPSWFAAEREKLGPNNLAPTCRQPLQTS